MKLKIIVFLFFLLANLVVYIITGINKSQRINIALDKHLEYLQTAVNTLEYHNTISADSANNILQHLAAKDLMQIHNAKSPKELQILRENIINKLAVPYKNLLKKGVFQVHFVLPDNKTFLRLHKPEKFGDDLSGIRYSHEYVHTYKKTIRGFESGKTTHAFRNVYPVFDKNKNYICSLEISFTTGHIQNYLTNINNLYSHILIHKSVFDVKAWESKNLQIPYMISAEHPEYYLSVTNNDNINNYINQNKKRIYNELDFIKENIDAKKPFAMYVHGVNQEERENDVDVLAFLPVKDTKNNIKAWIITYKPDQFISTTLFGNSVVRVISMIFFGIFFFFLYIVLNNKNILSSLVEEKTSELKNLNEDLEKQVDNKTKQLSDFVTVSADFMWEVDSNGIYTYASHGVFDILGYTPDEIIGKNPFDLMDIQEVQKVKSKYLRTYAKKSNLDDIKNWFIHKNGSKVLLQTNGVPIFEKNQFIGYRGTDKDITEDYNLHNQMQEKTHQLLEQSKMASMGQMIGNIAHQWRQPLTVISTLATGAVYQKQVGKLSDEKFEAEMYKINDQVQYLSKTIDTFRDFLKEKKERKTVSIQDTIDMALNIIGSSLKNYHIILQNNIDTSKDIPINIISAEVTEVLINIINNAKDILLEKNISEPVIIIDLIEEKDKIVITIEDNGGGIPKSILPRIFEPYFSTKHKSQGTGLGLHMAYKIIVESHHGKLYVKNTPLGAKFFIELIK